MALGDVLDTIGQGIKTTGRVAGAVLPAVAQVIGEANDPELGRERRQRDYQLTDEARQAKAQRIEEALRTMDEGPEKQALYQQYFDLFPGPEHAPALLERLRKITHPNGAVAQGPMQETLGAPNVGTLAQMLGNVPPPARGKLMQGTYDIPGAALQGKTDVWGNPVDPKGTYRRNLNPVTGEEEIVPSQPRMSGVPRVLPPISMAAAKTMAAQGIPFQDEAGEPIDVTKFDNTMQIVPVKVGNHTAYQVTSQGQTHLTVGNQVYAVPKFGQMDLASQGVPLGVARVPTSTTKQTIGVNTATGAAGIQPLTTVSTPQTTGVASPGVAPLTPATTPNDIAAAQEAAQPEAPAPPAFTPPSKARAKAKPIAQPAAAGTPAEPHAAAATAPNAPKPILMPPGMYNQQLQVARPLRVVSNQIFGDPARPEFQPLSAYGDVLANPASVKRIANVAKLMIGDLASADATKSGGFWTLLTTNAGLPQALAAAQARQTMEALNKLTPREKEFVDAAMDTYGSVIGLRAITKGSAAKFSAQSLEREVPLPGFALPGDRSAPFQFYDKLQRLGEEVNSGAKGNAVLTPEEKAFYDSQFARLGALKEAARTPWSKKAWLEKHPDRKDKIDADAKRAADEGRRVVD